MTELKRCSCVEHEGPDLLPLAEFRRDKNEADGLTFWCRGCLQRKDRRYRAAHPEKVRERYNQENRENAASLDTARHHREMWTGPQLAIAARNGLTVKQAAAMTGRSIRAVREARRRLRAGEWVVPRLPEDEAD